MHERELTRIERRLISLVSDAAKEIHRLLASVHVGQRYLRPLPSERGRCRSRDPEPGAADHADPTSSRPRMIAPRSESESSGRGDRPILLNSPAVRFPDPEPEGHRLVGDRVPLGERLRITRRRSFTIRAQSRAPAASEVTIWKSPGPITHHLRGIDSISFTSTAAG
jgi:hypothetical protein